MPLTALDHVNVRTTNLEEMKTWYREILGMESGDRPPFSFGGAWLYVGDHPAIHLVDVTREGVNASTGHELRLEHFSFSATGLIAFLDNLKVRNVDCRITRVPGFGILQVNLSDFDGNHLHVDFRGAEADDYKDA